MIETLEIISRIIQINVQNKGKKIYILEIEAFYILEMEKYTVIAFL